MWKSECGMGKFEWGSGNAEVGIRIWGIWNGEVGMRNAEFAMRILERGKGKIKLAFGLYQVFCGRTQS
jgi:hypothetical protein